MNRVLILGCPGSGKSTFARQLGALTGLPLVHLDNVYWLPDGTHLSPSAFDEALARLLREEQWILDGNYSRTYEGRIRACDTVFFWITTQRFAWRAWRNGWAGPGRTCPGRRNGRTRS